MDFHLIFFLSNKYINLMMTICKFRKESFFFFLKIYNYTFFLDNMKKIIFLILLVSYIITKEMEICFKNFEPYFLSLRIIFKITFRNFINRFCFTGFSTFFNNYRSKIDRKELIFRKTWVEQESMPVIYFYYDYFSI